MSVATLDFGLPMGAVERVAGDIRAPGARPLTEGDVKFSLVVFREARGEVALMLDEVGRLFARGINGRTYADRFRSVLERIEPLRTLASEAEKALAAQQSSLPPPVFADAATEVRLFVKDLDRLDRILRQALESVQVPAALDEERARRSEEAYRRGETKQLAPRS
jgi:hypothetical protein